MAMSTIEELFEHELKDIYGAEQSILEALDQLASETNDREIKKGIQQHRKETQAQLKRLEQAVLRLKLFIRRPVGRRRGRLDAALPLALGELLQPLVFDIAHGDARGGRIARRAEVGIRLERFLPRIGAPAGEQEQKRENSGERG